MSIQQAQLRKAEHCLRKMRYALDVAEKWESINMNVSKMWQKVAIYWLDKAIGYNAVHYM